MLRVLPLLEDMNIISLKKKKRWEIVANVGGKLCQLLLSFYWDSTHSVVVLVRSADHVSTDAIVGEPQPAALTQEERGPRNPSTLPHRIQTWWGHTIFYTLYAFMKWNQRSERGFFCKYGHTHLWFLIFSFPPLSSMWTNGWCPEFFHLWRTYKRTNQCFKWL